MGVNSVGSANSYTQTQQASSKPSSKENLEKVNDELLNPKDTYEPGTGKKSGSVNSKDNSTISQLWKDTNAQTEALRKMVEKLLGNSKDSKSQLYWANKALSSGEAEGIKSQAQQMISDDGFFGVEKTATRIMDFAKALAGDNASSETIDKLRAAVEKGFGEVAKAFGGGLSKLPEVSQKTYDSIMKQFDDWANSASDSAKS